MRKLIFLALISSSVQAKDYGVHGHTFSVEENDLLQVIQSRLNVLEESGDLERHKQEFTQRTQKRLRNPKAVEGIHKATQDRTYYYDPSLIVPYDLKDQEGTIFQRAGTIVSPLGTKPMRTTLVFIQGEDLDQVNWAAKTYLHEEKRVKIILVSGSPFDLMEAWDRPVYFDQVGIITKKLGIDAVPAIVEQEGLRLKISQIKIQETS